MTDWVLTFKIIGWGILATAVILSLVTLVMWLAGRVLRRAGVAGEENVDKEA